jgi:hypothetical protein
VFRNTRFSTRPPPKKQLRLPVEYVPNPVESALKSCRIDAKVLSNTPVMSEAGSRQQAAGSEQKQTAGNGPFGHPGQLGGPPGEFASRPPPATHSPMSGLWYIAPGSIRPRG